MGCGIVTELVVVMGILTTEALDFYRKECSQELESAVRSKRAAFETVEAVFQQAMTEATYH